MGGPTEAHQLRGKRRRSPRDLSSARDVVPSDRIIGAKIENMDGKDVGKVDQLLVDHNTGRIAYVVIRTGGFAGINAKHVMVPWSEAKSAWRQDRDNDRVVLRVDQAKLDKAPAWNRREASREQRSPSASPSTERSTDRDRTGTSSKNR